MQLSLHDTNDVVDIRDVMAVQPGVQTIDDADEAGGIAENGRTDGDGVGARHHEFNDVFRRRDAADSDDRHGNGLCIRKWICKRLIRRYFSKACFTMS